MRSLPRAVLFLASLAVASPALAQPVIGPAPGPGPAPAPAPAAGLIAKITPQQLVQILGGLTVNGQAVQTSVKTFEDGTAVVVTPLWGSQVYSGVALLNCAKDGSGCFWLHYFANLGKQPSIDSNWMNAFNRAFLGIRAYTLADGELLLSHDLLVAGVAQSDIAVNFLGFKAWVDQAFKFKP